METGKTFKSGRKEYEIISEFFHDNKNFYVCVTKNGNGFSYRVASTFDDGTPYIHV